MLNTNDKLSAQGKMLQDTVKVMEETDEVVLSVNRSLVDQRETLLNAKEKAQETKSISSQVCATYPLSWCPSFLFRISR